MSSELFKETKYLPQISLYCGGDNKKKCIQLKQLVNNEYKYIQIPVSKISALIRRLQKVIREDLDGS